MTLLFANTLSLLKAKSNSLLPYSHEVENAFWLSKARFFIPLASSFSISPKRKNMFLEKKSDKKFWDIFSVYRSR